MATWLAYQPPEDTADAAAQKTVFIKDGLSLGALAIPAIWLLFRRMWVVFLAWLAASIAIALLIPSLGPVVALLSTVFTIGFALEANTLRGWTLERKGYRLVGIVDADTRDDAEVRHFARPVSLVAPPVAVDRRPAVTTVTDPSAVIGLFPTAGGRA
jgi:Protein of unknown function (DUF2628)